MKRNEELDFQSWLILKKVASLPRSITMVNIYQTYIPTVEEATLLVARYPAIERQLSESLGYSDLSSFVAGRWLLNRLLADTGAKWSLDDISYNEAGRPMLPSGIDFNISHSKQVAICAISSHPIGIDLEFEKEIALNDFQDYLSKEEWDNMQHSTTPHTEFYRLWTAKEAILKARGTGLDTFPILNQQTTVSFQGTTYYLKALQPRPGYSCHLASTVPLPAIALKAFTIR